MSVAMHQEDIHRVAQVCARLHQDLQARAVMVVDKSGQYITSVGETDDLDTTSLASLTAGNVAATHGLAQLIGEKNFPSIVHEGEKEHLHLSVVAEWAILLVMFDQRTTLGMVRLRVQQSRSALTEALVALMRSDGPPQGAELAGITREEVDRLFGDL